MSAHFLSIRFPIISGDKFKLKLGFRYLSQGMQAEKGRRQIPRERPAVRRGNVFGKGYPLLIVPIAAFGLGTWQISRREWKLGLIRELEKKMSEPPIPLPDNLEEVKNMEYQKVKLRGFFDHTRELFIGPRSNFRDGQTAGGGQGSIPGVNVVTPFKLADRDETILVNRGYVPFKHQSPEMRPKGQVEGEVEITGVIRLNDKKAIIPNNPARDGYWLTRNVDEMAKAAQTANVFVEADADSTVPGGPNGGQTQVSLRNEHFTYILVWYTLSAFTFYLWYKNYRSPSLHKTILEYIKKEHKRM